MRKTYAYNSIIIGFLLGLLAWVSTDSMVLGVLACVMVSIVGFVIIRAIEKAVYKGADAAVDAVSKAYQKHKEQKENNIDE